MMTIRVMTIMMIVPYFFLSSLCHGFHTSSQTINKSYQHRHSSISSLSSSFHNNNNKSITKNSRTTISSFHSFSKKLLSFSTKTSSLSASTQNNNNDNNNIELIGKDSALFKLNEQNVIEWLKFSAAVATILSVLTYIWILPNGLHGGDIFLSTIQDNIIHTTDPSYTVGTMLFIFAILHSGLASLRTYAEPIVGQRIWRVLFASVSLPTALSCISYFVNHCHDGIQYWSIPHNDITHTLLFICNFISFLFLYPSTFDLLNIAAITKPQLSLWETGIIRITRHPQTFGQILWCTGHTLYLGTNVAIVTSAILILHHVFSVYHGDRRLQNKHGSNFEYIQNKTSIIPFAAIIDGRQQLPSNYYQEFIRFPYLLVCIGTTLAYFAHPYMQAGAALLHW